MRTIVVAAILLLGSSSAWPEPEYTGGQSVSSPVGSESSIATGNRKPVAAVPPLETLEPLQSTATPAPSGAPAPSGQGAPPPAANAGPAPPPTAARAENTPAHSLDEVCNTLFTSAQDNDLPVAFFANLIWQESRLRDHAVSPKGAMGIAQFMPQVAAKSGLENPFDPSQALPASAKLLRELFDQFGNLGYVAAAYNAGTQRVLDWLERGRSLPRETRGYVMNITGRSVEAWRKTPLDEAALRFARRLPCREMPAFAELEQAQAKQAELARAQAEQAQAEQAEQKHNKAEQAQAKQKTEPERKQTEVAQAEAAQAEVAQAKEKAKPERKQAEAARAQVSRQHVSTQHVSSQHAATQHATASQRKTAARQKTRLKTASRQKTTRLHPQKVANASTAKPSEKHAHFAKDDRSHKSIRREALRPAKRERSRVAKEHIRHAPHERHRPA
jgi:chemotaxis protein histidine kinase CheA